MTLPNLRVAILGGGLAGATLLRGLIKHSHLHVDIFESRPEFKEEGQEVPRHISPRAYERLTEPCRRRNRSPEQRSESAEGH